jgi:hypothetical protein
MRVINYKDFEQLTMLNCTRRQKHIFLHSNMLIEKESLKMALMIKLESH